METGKQGGDVTVQEGVRTASLPQKGPYIKDVRVRKIFGILDPLPPLSAFWLDL